MQLKIKEDAGTIFIQNHHPKIAYGGGMSPEARKFGDMITAVQGMTIEIETKYLWDDQFNTVPIEGISKNGLRILDFKGEKSIIEEIIDDERPSREKCIICGHYIREGDSPNAPCWWCGK